MLKKTKNKIILIFFIIGILAIAGVGIAFIHMLNNANGVIQADGLDNNGRISEILQGLTQKTEIILAVASVTFIAIVGIISFIISKFIVRPVDNTVELMTTELKNKLSEVSKQKNQMETILLHMTDGIIAFDMQGKIILINPEARRLLKISPEDSNFDDIFKNSSVDINMEKI